MSPRTQQEYRADAGEPALRRQNASGQAVPVAGGAREKLCRMHGGAPGSGAPKKNRSVFKHGLFTRGAIEQRKQVQALIGQSRKLLQDIE